MTFLKSGGQLWDVEDYWTQVGIATGHSAAVAYLNWSPAHISASNFGFFQNFLVAVVFSSYGQLVGTRTSCCP